MLVANGHSVTAMTRSADKAPAIEAMGAEAAVTDVFDAERLSEAVGAARPEAVIHQLTDLPKEIDFRKVETQLAGNDRIRTEGTRNLVAAAQAAGVSTFVAQSIAFGYRNDGDGLKREDDPLDLEAEWPWRRSMEALRDLEDATTSTDGLRGVVLRYGYFYGPDTVFDPAGGSTAEMVRKRRYPVVGGGGGVFSFVHVDDAARAAVIAVEGGASGIFNVVDDEPAPVREWLPLYAAAIGAKPPRRLPAFVARLLAGGRLVALATQQRGADNAKAKRELGWEPRFPSWRTGSLGSRNDETSQVHA
jgi:nucleoside-diphosphate-sugar epimerase